MSPTGSSRAAHPVIIRTKGAPISTHWKDDKVTPEECRKALPAMDREKKDRTYRIYSRIPSTFGLKLALSCRFRLASTWNFVGHSLLADSPLTKSSTLAKGITATRSFLSHQPSTLDHTRSAAENSKVGGFCTGRKVDDFGKPVPVPENWVKKFHFFLVAVKSVKANRLGFTW